MSTTVVLLIASAVLGTVIGAKYCIFTIIGLAPVLGIVAVLAVRDIYVAPADEFAFAYLCIIVSQTAYFLTAWLDLLRGKWHFPNAWTGRRPHGFLRGHRAAGGFRSRWRSGRRVKISTSA